MKTHDLIQGSPRWLAHRAAGFNGRPFFNASDAPAALGCSPFKTRAELLRELHTGMAAEVDAGTQRRFDDGHRFEALARPLAEQIIGQDLYPVTGSEGRYSASFDGLTLDESVAFEHKGLSAGLLDTFDHAGPGIVGADLPKHYRVQMEQQCMVSGAASVLFMATKWADDDALIDSRHCWYTPDAELRAEIIGAWQQFAADLAAYTPPPLVEKAQAEPMDSLPAVAVRLDGALTVAGNLPSFAAALKSFIARMPKQPATDTDFATTDAACKALKKAEDALDAAEQGALASITDVEAMRRAVADCRKLARDTRLAAEKLVERRKVEIKEQAVTAARRALDDHIAGLNAELAPMRLPAVAADFPGAIKGLRSIASMQDALDTTLANGKIAADAQARLVRANVAHFHKTAVGMEFLFSDLAALVHKSPDDFEAVLAGRIRKQMDLVEAQEKKRQADEAARIAAAEQRAREQEAARIAEQQRQQAAAEAEAKRQADAALATAAAPAPNDITEGQHPQQVLKATPATADATDRGTAANVSPRGGAMGAGQPAAADPAVASEPATVKLGDLADTLGLTLRGDFIEQTLGIKPAGRERGAVLFQSRQVPLIVIALQRHLARVLAGLSEAA